MMSSDWNSGNVNLKCANFCLYIFFANFGRFLNIKYMQNFLLNGISENKYTKYTKIHKYTKFKFPENKYTKKKCRKKCALIQLFFLESINNNSFSS